MGFSAVAAFTRLYSMRVWRMAVSLAGAGVYIAIAYLTYDVLRYNGQVVIAASKVTAWILGGPYAMFAQLWFGDNFLVLILGGLVFTHLFWPAPKSSELRKPVRYYLWITLGGGLVGYIANIWLHPELILDTLTVAAWFGLGLIWYSVWTESAEAGKPHVLKRAKLAWENRIKNLDDLAVWLGIESAQSSEGQDAGQAKHDDGNDAVQHPPKDGSGH